MTVTALDENKPPPLPPIALEDDDDFWERTIRRLEKTIRSESTEDDAEDALLFSTDQSEGDAFNDHGSPSFWDEAIRRLMKTTDPKRAMDRSHSPDSDASQENIGADSLKPLDLAGQAAPAKIPGPSKAPEISLEAKFANIVGALTLFRISIIERELSSMLSRPSVKREAGDAFDPIYTSNLATSRMKEDLEAIQSAMEALENGLMEMKEFQKLRLHALQDEEKRTAHELAYYEEKINSFDKKQEVGFPAPQNAGVERPRAKKDKNQTEKTNDDVARFHVSVLLKYFLMVRTLWQNMGHTEDGTI
ncbi:hypothetical protein HDU96_004208 [Phlyctochytrium bullatum]|nr:hypothetical protein HDU96_004208 [Phlyctochytrium bullatum]